MINKDSNFIQYNREDLVYIISLLTSQLKTSSRKVAIKYIGTLVVYKIIDPYNYLLMTSGGEILRGLLNMRDQIPAIIRTNQGNAYTLLQLKQAVNMGMTV